MRRAMPLISISLAMMTTMFCAKALAASRPSIKLNRVYACVAKPSSSDDVPLQQFFLFRSDNTVKFISFDTIGVMPPGSSEMGSIKATLTGSRTQTAEGRKAFSFPSRARGTSIAMNPDSVYESWLFTPLTDKSWAEEVKYPNQTAHYTLNCAPM